MKETKNVQIIVLAAGKGSRMQSSLPKVLHLVSGKPMLDRVIDNALCVTDDVIVVYSEMISEHLKSYEDRCKLVLQKDSVLRGTGYAVRCAFRLINKNKINVVLFADNPLITPNLIKKLVEELVETKSHLVALAFNRSDPGEYGRIVTDKSGRFLWIVESKLAKEEEKKITLCNSGVMAFAPSILLEYLPVCLPNRLGEFCLSDVVDICRCLRKKVSYLLAPNSDEVVGVNTQEDLKEANRIFKELNK